jgi:hypothetical protein
MITNPETIQAQKRQKAAAFRARHGAAYLAYHRDLVQRQRAEARRQAGKPPTRCDLALPARPIPCPSTR